MQVVALGSGTKCLGREALRKDGCVIRDCHAEVLCRRAFKWYLMNEVEKATKERTASDVYEWKDEHLTVRRDVRFHMFVSQPPCGDACIPAVPDEKRDDRQRRSQDKTTTWELHTGAKRLLQDDRTGPLDGVHQRAGVLRLKPGRGIPTRSVCCTDKISRWTYTGMQGAMLALITDPVYLCTLVLPTMATNLTAAKRAFVDRLTSKLGKEDISQEGGVYGLHPLRVETSAVKNVELIRPTSKDDARRPSTFAIVWARGALPQGEIVLAKTGLLAGTTRKDGRAEIVPVKCRSMFCTAALFTKFAMLCVTFPARSSRTMLGQLGAAVRALKEDADPSEISNEDGESRRPGESPTYLRVKMTSSAYQRAKARFITRVFPTWPATDTSLLSFSFASASMAAYFRRADRGRRKRARDDD